MTDPHNDRIACAQCARLVSGACRAAALGAIIAGPRYRPLITIMRRCLGFTPMHGDAGRRTGAERWPTLPP